MKQYVVFMKNEVILIRILLSRKFFNTIRHHSYVTNDHLNHGDRTTHDSVVVNIGSHEKW